MAAQKEKNQGTNNMNEQINVETSAVEEKVIVDVEKEQLKSELEQLKAMMAELINQQDQTKLESTNSNINKNLFETTEERYDIDPKQYFSIASMVNGGLHLKGLHIIHSIPDFGNSISVSFEDLRAIVNNHPNPTREGMFLIKNEKAVKALSLDRYYEKFISPEMIEKFMLLSNHEIKETFDNITDFIKQTIIEKIVEGVVNGDSLYQDRNKVKFIGDLVGKNLYDYVREIEDAQ
jgi:hypothetical protein